ncbi:MAG: PilN domain-containing protein [Gemmatirosa sp.]|nr:PilN domain-containing protein [Gemmatirosa sp.]
MQIRINLHAQRSTRRSRLSLGAPSEALARVLAPARDRYLMGAVAAVAVSCAAVAALYLTQTRAAEAAEAREQVAVRDSTRYAGMIAARARVLARRDSVARQLRVISAIDSTRYLWAHVLDEVSRTLPPYTWLTNVSQTSAPPAPPSTMPKAGAKPAAPAPGAPKGADSTSDVMRFRIVGHTVDLQALTLFMRDLEASPFVRNVQLAHSDPVPGDGKDVTEFTLDAEYERPAREALRTTSITVPVK